MKDESHRQHKIWPTHLGGVWQWNFFCKNKSFIGFKHGFKAISFADCLAIKSNVGHSNKLLDDVSGLLIQGGSIPKNPIQIGK